MTMENSWESVPVTSYKEQGLPTTSLKGAWKCYLKNSETQRMGKFALVNDQSTPTISLHTDAGESV